MSLFAKKEENTIITLLGDFLSCSYWIMACIDFGYKLELTQVSVSLAEGVAAVHLLLSIYKCPEERAGVPKMKR